MNRITEDAIEQTALEWLANLVKATVSDSEKSPEDMESAIRQLVSRAVSSTEVVDIFAAAGLNKPDISILSDEFLAEVQQLPQRNLALELLKKLLNDEIKTQMRKNVVQARSCADSGFGEARSAPVWIPAG